MKQKKIALFGGTFDPIHLAHTKVVQAAIDYLHVDRVVFIPAKRSPLKDAFPQATDEQRLHMLECAISGNNHFDVSDYELNGPAPSYTLNTIKHFKDILGPTYSIYWLMGADAVKDLGEWYGVTELMDLCIPTVMVRPGCPHPDFSPFKVFLGEERIKKLQSNLLQTPLIDISSTQVRALLSQDKDARKFLAPEVYAYILSEGMYKTGTNG
jgi:nicotinate-nucleotide adenylyltransferase